MEEKELLKLAKTDESSMEVLLTQYKPLVSKIARQYFAMGGEYDDLVQEGMIGLYKAIQNYDDSKDASFKTFASLCITRQMLSAIRKTKTIKGKMFAELLDDELITADTVSDIENPEELIISKQKGEFISKEIQNSLSEYELKVLIKYCSGMTYDDIATECGVAKKSIDNALSRIRSKLLYLLDDINY